MLEGTDTFEVKEEHLKLLKMAYVSWNGCEYGSPSVDCKRPYGNRGVAEDIAQILGWEINEEEGLSEEQEEKAREIHQETKTALQIALSTQEFKKGTYLNYEKYCDNKWKRIN